MTDYWKIMALRMGEVTLDKSQFTIGKDPGKMINCPILSFAVYGNDKKILVDTGVSDPEWVRANHGPFSQKKDEVMETALDKYLGWKPGEVDIIINTHLHHDHCGWNKLFINSALYVQRKEWDIALKPTRYLSPHYRQSYFDSSEVNYFQWKFLNGECEILSGISVFPTPGHTEGHQSVLVNTKSGVICITGDICNLQESFDEEYPSTLTTSFDDVYASLAAIRARARYFIPSHDPQIKSGQTDGFPLVKR